MLLFNQNMHLFRDVDQVIFSGANITAFPPHQMQELALLVAGVQNSLTGLYQTIEARLALYKPLTSLQGRLDLVLAQAAPVDPLASHLAAAPQVSPPRTHMGLSCTMCAGVQQFFKSVIKSL